MTNITLRPLRRSLEALLERVAPGERFIIVEHGKPIAQLVSPTAPGVHVGSRFATASRIAPLGARLTRGAYLTALAEDRCVGDQ